MAVSDVSFARPWPEPDGERRAGEGQVESYRRLAEVFHHVLSEQSLDTLLDRIADTLGDLVPYDALQIYEADTTRRELVPVLARSEWESEIMRTRPSFGQGITGWAVDKQEPVLANQAHLDPRVAFIPGTPPEPEALISIPLVARGALKGALNIYRLGEDATFDEDEFELAKWFSDAAALALDNAQVRAQLEHQAQTDSLTGLYNHRYFYERLRAELTRAGRARDSVALLMLDIDEFKRVNDVLGHAVGDEVLRGLAETVSSLVRSSDVVCRVGGEELAVILPSCGSDAAAGLARRLVERLKGGLVEAVGEVTVSIGIAHGPDHAGNPRELVACAESAMMTAKARGGNRVVVHGGADGERPDRHDPGRDVRSIAHLKMLQSVAGRLNRLNSVRDIAEAIASELRGLIDYHSCRVYIVEGEELVPVAVRGDGVAEEQIVQARRIGLGSGITGHVAESGRSVLIENALDCDFAIQIPGTDLVDESVVAAPLRYDARVTGVVFLSKLGAGQFDESDLRLLEVLAGYAAVSLENARLYESLRLEAEHARAWLDFADAISGADTIERIAAEAVTATAGLADYDTAYLWLEDRVEGDYVCVAAAGGDEEEAIRRARVPRLTGEALIETASPTRVLAAGELRELFRLADVPGELGVAPLASGPGVRGWLAVAGPEAGLDGERLRLLEGLAYRSAMALQQAQLRRRQKQSLEVADALLDYSRALAAAQERGQVEESVVRLAAEILDAESVVLWSQRSPGGDVEPAAICDEDVERRLRLAAGRFAAEIAAPFSARQEPFVLAPGDYAGIPGAPELADGADVAVAPFSLPGGRMAFLVGSVRPGATFSELQLRLLAGFADQAKLAISPPS